MATQVITASGTSANVTGIVSTKVRVTANATVQWTVGTGNTSVAFVNNAEVIAGGTTRFINMKGLNNNLAIICASGVTNALVSVTDVGSVSSTAIMGSTTYLTI